MKVGNVILAIFLWLCIPIAFLVGSFFGIGATLFGGSVEGAMCCTFGAPLILFILGLVILIIGIEKPKPIEKELVEEKKKVELKKKEEEKLSKESEKQEEPKEQKRIFG